MWCYTPKAAKAHKRRASRRLRAPIINTRKDVATVDKVVVFAKGNG
jgi:RNase P protein component